MKRKVVKIVDGKTVEVWESMGRGQGKPRTASAGPIIATKNRYQGKKPR